MKIFKEREVVKLVATDKSEISLGNMGSGMIRHTDIRPDYDKRAYMHLYVLSDDKLKAGEWGIANTGLLLTPLLATEENILKLKDYSFKKIIATTDTKLKIKDYTGVVDESNGIKEYWENSLPCLSDNFITDYVEEFNKGNNIKKILVEYYTDLDKNDLGMWVGGTSKYYLQLNNNNNKINTQILKKEYHFTKNELIKFMKRFKNDLNYSKFYKKYSSILTLHEMEEKWFEENLK